MPVGHYENFPVASRLVPPELRRAVVAIYRFARSADDIADEGDATPEQRLDELARYAAALDAIEAGGTPPEPPLRELALCVRAHALPVAPLRDLLDAFRQDVRTHRYARFDDLLDYCRRSANPVGRILLALYKADSPGIASASDDVCTGLQLANLWQDVAQDWQRGRLYLPQEDLARFEVDESQIENRQADDRWRELMRFETGRARERLLRGRRLVPALPLRLSLELSAVIAGGLRVLERIDAAGGDVFRRRPVLRAPDWAIVAGRALAARAFGAAR